MRWRRITSDLHLILAVVAGLGRRSAEAKRTYLVRLGERPPVYLAVPQISHDAMTALPCIDRQLDTWREVSRLVLI